MLDLTDVLKTDLVDSPDTSIPKIYNEPNAPSEAANNGDDIDEIDLDIVLLLTQGLIRSEIASRRQAATDANEAISFIQIFDKAVLTIIDKLTQMSELALESAGSSRTYTDVEKAAMQKSFNELAGEINTIVNSTKSGGNKFLSTKGKAISVTINSNSVILISPRDLSIDVEGLDLSVDPGGFVHSTIQAWMEQTSDYRDYLAGKSEKLQETSTMMAFEITDSIGVMTMLDKINAMETASKIGNKIIDETSILVAIQANVTPQTALQLLSE